jgi:predicted DCC family thiol-disulfide oxidoreductase YuxK
MSGEMTPVLVYDGTCGFCTRSVRFILARDRRGTLRFATRDSAFGRQVRQRHAALAEVESLLWLEFVNGEERVRWYSDAVLASARYLGGVYGVLGWLGALVPRVVRDPVYRLIAAVRQRLVKGGACALPSPSELARMLP